MNDKLMELWKLSEDKNRFGASGHDRKMLQHELTSLNQELVQKNSVLVKQIQDLLQKMASEKEPCSRTQLEMPVQPEKQ